MNEDTGWPLPRSASPYDGLVTIPSYILEYLIHDCSDEERRVYLAFLLAKAEPLWYTSTPNLRDLACWAAMPERRLLWTLACMMAKHLLTRVNRGSAGWSWRLRREEEGTQQIVLEQGTRL